MKKLQPSNEATAATVEATIATIKATAATIITNVDTIEATSSEATLAAAIEVSAIYAVTETIEGSPENKRTAATAFEPNKPDENPSSSVQNLNSKWVSCPKNTTLVGTVKKTLRLLLFRTGSLSLVGFIVYIVAYNNDKEMTFSPRLIVLIGRSFAFFLPLVGILFDREIRVYVFFKLRQWWNSI